MVILRILGAWFLLAAVVSMVVDGTRSLAANEILFISLGDQWLAVAPQSLAAAQTFVVETLHALLWDPVIAAVLLWPAWAFFGGLGLGLLWIGRKRHRTSIFAN